jgi:eukaryotic-like serine/threonine-protein kinase
VESGEAFGDYSLLELLGIGGMARVYRAAPRRGGSQVALKIIRRHVAENPRLVRALINEARLGIQLHHPNVVETYEFDNVGERYYIAMEYVDGYSVREVMQRSGLRGQLPHHVIAEIMRQVCDALHYVHSAPDDRGRPINLIHRDLKPSNVMFSMDGVVKLMDFGLAKADTHEYETTLSKMTKGTPLYMSPEQVRRRPLDQRSDVFAMGSLLAEMVTGRPVFRSGVLARVLLKVVRGDTGNTLESVERLFPAALPVVRRALQVEPERRFADAAEMAQALRVMADQVDGGEALGPWLAARMS